MAKVEWKRVGRISSCFSATVCTRFRAYCSPASAWPPRPLPPSLNPAQCSRKLRTCMICDDVVQRVYRRNDQQLECTAGEELRPTGKKVTAVPQPSHAGMPSVSSEMRGRICELPKRSGCVRIPPYVRRRSRVEQAGGTPSRYVESRNGSGPPKAHNNLATSGLEFPQAWGVSAGMMTVCWGPTM
jgi:hypothetical protein